MNHRPLHITRLLLILFSALSLHASAGTLGSLTYEIVNGTSVTITDCDEAATGTIVIPETIESLPVTTIGENAFRDCTNIEHISAPDSITKIQSYAFINCGNITSITLPTSLEEIGSAAFRNCISLQSISLPNSLVRIYDRAFYNCVSLQQTTLPPNLTNIGEYAFMYCSALQSISIPEGITEIPTQLFYSCSELSTVTLPESLTKISSRAFYRCDKLGTINIPASVNLIASDALTSCPSLQSITVDVANTNYKSSGGVLYSADLTLLHTYPAGLQDPSEYTIASHVTTLGQQCFEGCTSLVSINIPPSVTSIHYTAFNDCSNLLNINANLSNTIYSSIDGVLFETTSNTLFICPQGKVGTYTIPQNTTTLSTYAFSGCEKLTEINIPSSVTNIHHRSFTDCSGLQNLNVDSSNTAYSSTDGVLFESASNTLVTYPRGRAGKYDIPEGTETIGIYAFSQCTQLTQITLPPTVTWIRYGAFRYCTNLTDLVFPEGLEYIDTYAFLRCDSLTKVTLPTSLKGSTGYGGAIFSYCAKLKSVTLSPNFRTIYSSFFWGCPALEEIIIPEGILNIGSSIFAAAKSPPRLILPSSIIQIVSINTTDLQELYFLGNAPTLNNNYPFYAGTTIYHLKGATGFDVAPWTNYNLVEIDTSTYPNAAWLLENQQDHTLSLNEDPNGDGVPLLMEYALGLKAYQNNASNLPQMDIGETTAGITFQGDTPGINYEVWTSTDLSNWTQTGVSLSTPDANGKRTATIPHSASSKAFLQLRVSQ